MYASRTAFPALAMALWLLPASAAERPAGVANFEQVDARVFRGAQPTAAGITSLAKLEIATVVDLREPGSRSRREERLVRAAGMRYVNVPMKSLGAPGREEVARVLALLEAEDGGRVFVHCRRGKDRTGTVIACYRIAHDGWSNGRALAEAKAHGMSRVERGMRAFILGYRPAALNSQ